MSTYRANGGAHYSVGDMRTWQPRLLAGVAISAGLAGCGSPPPGNAQTLLTRAKTLMDSAPSAHFTLSSSGAGGGGVVLLGGSGDIKRPDRFSGTLNASVNGFGIAIPVVAVNGKFWASNPLSGHFESADPTQYGFADPGHLIDPQNGLSSLLLRCQRPTQTADDRFNGALLHEVSCSLPGQDVKALLADAAPDQAVAATVGVAADSGQLRRVVLTGPFYSSSKSSTFTLVVDNYGENVSVTPPPAGS